MNFWSIILYLTLCAAVAKYHQHIIYHFLWLRRTSTLALAASYFCDLLWRQYFDDTKLQFILGSHGVINIRYQLRRLRSRPRCGRDQDLTETEPRLSIIVENFWYRPTSKALDSLFDTSQLAWSRPSLTFQRKIWHLLSSDTETWPRPLSRESQERIDVFKTLILLLILSINYFILWRPSRPILGLLMQRNLTIHTAPSHILFRRTNQRKSLKNDNQKFFITNEKE